MTEKENRYWEVAGDVLSWKENAYSELSDRLDFEVERLDPSFSLQVIADRLDESAKGEDENESWEVCCNVVWRAAYTLDGCQRTAIATLSCLGGNYSVSNEHDIEPSNRATRRLEKHGCTHATKHHVVGSESN